MMPDTNHIRRTTAPLVRRDRPVMIPSTRKSCDNCHTQKRKCDGDGRGKCGRCAKHRQECIYSSRTRRAKKALPPPKAPKKPRRREGVRGDVGAGAGTPTPGVCSIDRSSLGASAATGLVGMQENALLKNFFCCLGFLPLTSQSVIREGVVRILCPIATRPVDVVAAADSRDGLGHNISVCTLWCAVAMGGLVEGQPAKRVERYFQMAEEGLKSCTEWNTPTPALAQAWAMLADTYSFTGDMDRFRRYMQRARSLLQAVLQRSLDVKLPTGLLELLMCERDKNGSGPETTRWGKRPPRTVSIHATASEGDIFAFHVKSTNLLQDSMRRRSEWRRECLGEADACCSPCPEEIIDDLRECVAPFEALEEAIDKPEIREGTGALMISSMIMMAKALKGDVPAARKRLARIVDVVERYPGMSTNLMGKHISHSAAAWLAATDDPFCRGLYGRLQEAYNSAFCAGSRHPLPSYDCWPGADDCLKKICDNPVCREVAMLVEEWPISLPSPSPSPSPSLPHTDAIHRVHSGDQAPPTACVLGESDGVHPSFPSLSLPKANGVHGTTAIPRPGSPRQEDKAEDLPLLDDPPSMELQETTETLPPPLLGQNPAATQYHDHEGFGADGGVPYEPPGSAPPETINPSVYAVIVQGLRDLEGPRPRGDSGGERLAEGEDLSDLSYLMLDDSDSEMAFLEAAAMMTAMDDDPGAPNFFDDTYAMMVSK